MKILYGVQGTGNGHITRARALSKALTEENLEVDYLFSGRSRDQYFDMDPFGDWVCRRGLTFASGNGKIDILKTARENSLVDFFRDVRSVKVDHYDLVLCDYEPITARAARRSTTPVIGVGHQYAFDFPVPLRGDSWATRTLMRNFAPVDIGLGLHWGRFDSPILPPITEPVEFSRATQQDKVVVYLGFEDPENVIALLQEHPDYEFYYYGEFSNPEDRGHIHLRPLSRQGFQDDLSSSVGVISNAGFELTSEALQLGIKILVKPLKGQMEQESNALALEQLGYGHSMDRLDPDAVGRWLEDVTINRVVYPDVAAAIAGWIADGGWTTESRERLCEQLWSEVSVQRGSGTSYQL